MIFRRMLLAAWTSAAALLTATGFEGGGSVTILSREQSFTQQALPFAAQGSMARGVKATFETLRGDKIRHSQRTRLMSLAVGRGETPTPFLPAGAFRATFEAVLTLPARDRMKFHIDGRGKVKLIVNGKSVLDGSLRAKQSLETAKAVRLKKGGNDIRVEFESAARGDGELRIFWSGFDFGFEPIKPELMSYPVTDEAVVAGEQLRHGHRLFVESRCARCHDYDDQRLSESAYQELDRMGPDLRLVGSRAHQGWLAEWMKDPHKIRPDATMPKFTMADSDAVDIASYLATLGQAQPHGGFTQTQVEAGEQRFRELGCVACHARTDESAKDAENGDRIHLAFVKQKWQPHALIAYIQDPAAHYEDVRMPNLKVSPDDAANLAAYLLDGAAALPIKKGDDKKGRRLVRKHGCYVCHVLGEDIPPVDSQFPRQRNLKPKRGCLADSPNGAAPDYGFSDVERAALREFLPVAHQVPFRKSPLDFAARHVAVERCTACHALDGQASTWAQLAEKWSEDAPLPPEQDPVAQGLPALTWVGAKLQPSWIRKFVIGQLPSPRPWLTARMPAFEKHGVAITDGLIREHGYTSKDEPIRAGGANLSMHGNRLLQQGTGFGCVQCHAVGDNKAEQVFEREGINLLISRQRLRHEYYTRWLADPTRLDPDARMPKYADSDGKTAFTDVLGGDAAKQFEAIWQSLGDRTK